MTLTITCPAFSNGDPILPRYTCSGDNQSPELEWTDLPKNTQSLVLILEDPDAPGGTFHHWLLYDIDPALGRLPAALPKSPLISGIGRQGMNSFGRIGYDGPCPPPGRQHRYYLHLYALGHILGIKAGMNAREVENAMQGDLLAQADTFGVFKRG